MNVTNHAYERYCKRFLGLNDDKEIKQYLMKNKEQITEEMNKIFDGATFLWKGALNNGECRNWYINDNIIIMCNPTNDAIMTILKVDFDFGEKTDKKIAHDLTKEILKLQSKMTKEKDKINKENERYNIEFDKLDVEINCLEEQLDILKRKKQLYQKTIENNNNNLRMLELEIKNKVNRLCYSIEYRKEILLAK